MKSSLNIVERESLPLVIDGKEWKITARDLSRSHTLAEFIHTHFGRSARQACGEGGCGACAVIVTRPCAANESVTWFTSAPQVSRSDKWWRNSLVIHRSFVPVS